MSNNQTIGIIVFDDVLVTEVIAPIEIFSRANEHDWFPETDIRLISVEPQATIRTAEGIEFCVDTTISDDLSVDVLWVPGSLDVSNLLDNEKLNTFIQKHNDAQWVASVCAGAFVLGNAGVLDDRQATTWFGGEPSLQEQFPKIQVVHDAPVVVDNRRVTANGGIVSYQAAIVLLGQMTSPQHAKTIYDSLGMGRLSDWDSIAQQLTS